VSGSWWAYLLVLLGTIALCAGLAVVVTKITGRYVALHGGSNHKILTRGLRAGAIVLTFVVAVPVSSVMRPLAGGREGLTTVLMVAVALFIVGLVDESLQLLPSWHIGAEITGATIVWAIGSGIMLQGQIPGVVALGLTISWFVVVANAFQLIDNTSGLAAGLATIACLSLFAIALTNEQVLLSVLSIALTGCTTGFLIHNLDSNQTHLGKGGTQLVSFIVAYLCLKLFRIDATFVVSALTPILICSVVLFNLLLVVAFHLLNRHRPTPKGYDGLHYRLIAVGLQPTVAVGVVYFGATLIGVLTFIANRVDPILGLILISVIGLVFLASGIYFLQVALSKNIESRTMIW